MLAFRDELSTVDWSQVLSNDSVNNKFDQFISTFDNLHNKHFPPKQIKIRNVNGFQTVDNKRY